MEAQPTKPMQEKQKDCGGVWVKTFQKDGEAQTYLSFSMEINGEKKQFVAFPNQYKKEDKHPDYRIYPSRPRQ